jgi:hypothetical protein
MNEYILFAIGILIGGMSGVIILIQLIGIIGLLIQINLAITKCHTYYMSI